MKMKEAHFMHKSKKLLRVCRDIDADSSGDLSLEELLAGFDAHEDLMMILQDMGVDREDLSTVFQIMDADRSGKVDYKEFVHHIYKMRTADEHTTLNFIRHYVMQIQRSLLQQGRRHMRPSTSPSHSATSDDDPYRDAVTSADD